MPRRHRLTPLGAVLLTLLALALVALFLGSNTVQGIGFVVALLVALVLLADLLPKMRILGGHPLEPLEPPRRPFPGESDPRATPEARDRASRRTP